MFDKHYGSAAVLVGSATLALAVARCEPNFVDATGQDGRFQKAVVRYEPGAANPGTGCTSNRVPCNN